MPTTPHTDLQLPAELTIYTAAETRSAWLNWLASEAGGDHDGACRVDGGAVDQVDAAGLQLLLALRQRLARDDRSLRLTRASPPLRSACDALGLADLLDGLELAE